MNNLVSKIVGVVGSALVFLNVGTASPGTQQLPIYTKTVTFQDGLNGYSGSRDTYISEAQPTRRYSSDASLKAGGSRGSAILVKWYLPSIPTTSTVKSALAHFTVSDSSESTYTVYEATRDWAENQATWNELATGFKWTRAGARGSSDRGPVVGTLKATGTGQATILFNERGVAAIQRWVNNPGTNYGFVIDGPYPDGLSLVSREGAIGSRPALLVTYTEPVVQKVTAKNPTKVPPAKPTSRLTPATTPSTTISPTSTPGPTGVPVSNATPGVSAGSDVTTTLSDPTALVGSASDPDNGPSSLSLVWSKVSGPGTVAFENGYAATTTATFDQLGSYVLRLTATDGEATAWDDVSILVTEQFRLIVMPDTQKYSRTYPTIYTSQTSWIATSSASLNTEMVLHVGDVVDTWSSTTEWTRADASMDYLDGVVPYIVALGNHDWQNSDNRVTTNFNTYFGTSRFSNQAHFGGTYAANKMENAYFYFSAGGVDFMVITLEFGPRQAVIDWANTLAAANPTRKIIIVTHDYMNYDDTLHGSSPTHNYGPDYFGLTDAHSGQQIWDELVKLHANMFMVLSGHVHLANDGAGTLVGVGNHGNLVYQMEADYQDFTSGGNGYLRILTINPQGGTIQVQTYSPYLSTYMSDSQNEFTFTGVDFFGSSYTPSPTATPTPGPTAVPTPTATPTPTPVLQAHWQMEDGSGTTLSDATGHGYTGTLVGSATWTTGKSGSGVSFDGSSGYATGNPVTASLVGGNMTAMAWVNTSMAGTTSPEIFSFHTSAYANKILVFLNSTGRLTLHDGTNTASNGSGTVVNDGAWHHVAVTLDDANNLLSLYIDGELDTSTSSAISMASGDTFSLAQEWDTGPVASNFLNGIFDEVRVYSSLLSGTEIFTIYNSN